MLSLPITPQDFLEKCVIPGLALLPMKMDSMEARVMLVSIAQQESGLAHRYQVLNGTTAKGPARGLYQFERGSKASRGGVWGVYLHEGSSAHLQRVCDERDVAFTPDSIYAAIETDDLFSTAVARLMLWTDPKPLPKPSDSEAAWETYTRIWRPGKPHPRTWKRYHSTALQLCDRRK